MCRYFDNSAEAVKRLLQTGATYDHRGSEGSTALMTAAETLNEDVVSAPCCYGYWVTMCMCACVLGRM